MIQSPTPTTAGHTDQSTEYQRQRSQCLRGAPAWRQCESRSWSVIWPGCGQDALLVYDHRPTALRLARQSTTLHPGIPPTVATMSACLNHPGPPRLGDLRALPRLYRHWQWWRKNADVLPFRRGDNRLTALAHAQPPVPTQLQQARLRINLTNEDAYVALIALTLSRDLWVRRLRRRRVTIAQEPPQLPRLLRSLFWAHHPRGDLTWAPPPPQPRALPSPTPRPTRGPLPYQHHYHGSWLLRGGAGPLPRGYHPLPPPRQ